MEMARKDLDLSDSSQKSDLGQSHGFRCIGMSFTDNYLHRRA